jgi:hypothetical protein
MAATLRPVVPRQDHLGDDAQAGVVVAGMPARELVGLIYPDRVVLGGDSRGLFDDDP